jgi:hypothetical protein
LGERIEGSGFMVVGAVRVGGEAKAGVSGKLEDLGQELLAVCVDSVTDVRDWRGLGEVDDDLEGWVCVRHVVFLLCVNEGLGSVGCVCEAVVCSCWQSQDVLGSLGVAAEVIVKLAEHFGRDLLDADWFSVNGSARLCPNGVLYGEF